MVLILLLLCIGISFALGSQQQQNNINQQQKSNIMNTQTHGILEGLKTQFYTDVKLPIFAGMKLGTKDNKMKRVGHEVYRLFFDTIEKDFQVGRQRIKRVLNG